MTPRDAEEIRSYTLPQSYDGSPMTAATIAFGQFEMLREIAAQLALMNERAQKRESAKPAAGKASISSAARRTSNSKMFYVGAPWGTYQKDDMLRNFIPAEGAKALDDLAMEEETHGQLGTLADIKITRRQ